MEAIRGYYEDGAVKLEKKAPIRKGRVIMLFTDDNSTKQSMSDDEAMMLFNKFTGCIKRDIDVEKERDEYLNEKYGPIN